MKRIFLIIVLLSFSLGWSIELPPPPSPSLSLSCSPLLVIDGVPYDTCEGEYKGKNFEEILLMLNIENEDIIGLNVYNGSTAIALYGNAAVNGVIILTTKRANPINTDRPDQSEGTYVMHKGSFQIENGVQLGKESAENDLMLRYGLGSGTEVRLEGDFNLRERLLFEKLALSAKKRLFKGKGWLPEMTLVGYAEYDEGADRQYMLDACLAFANDLPAGFGLAYNIGSVDYFKALKATFEVNYSPMWRVAFFGEYFGQYTSTDKPAHGLDFGVQYLITRKCQVDAVWGRNIYSEEANGFVAVGFSYRFGEW
jgi:hypothetical protein